MTTLDVGIAALCSSLTALPATADRGALLTLTPAYGGRRTGVGPRGWRGSEPRGAGSWAVYS
jgi:hypothetical protein